ncbi:hypothetical protein E8E13_006453 [Curvularia kusanoi]|uniref:Zn(2)-C6 fungal-type domain-containing protein n=1 Tax=Curvularia kusanoi TaxID=90978 RepID=A0A9P4WE24_CURKU|nr:hypothetical protein E8E13_006453 [Curvularia kusanoi]
MPSERQRPAARGCWTCKVRRKKCEPNVGGVSGCKDCTFLKLECHNSTEKPIWMDNGTRQQQMADYLKVQVKKHAAIRVRLRKIRNLAEGLDESSVDNEVRSPRALELAETHTTRTSMPTPSTASSSVASPRFNDATQLETNPQNAGDSLAQSPPTIETIAGNEPPDIEPSLLTSYLDYAFPVLFPFYQPSVFEGGRAWLLALALKHPAFYHNIVGMAAYFYCAVPVMPGPAHDTCVDKAQTELQVHMEKAVRGVQDSLHRTTVTGVQHSLTDNVHLLGNIVQLVNFEVAFSSSQGWQIHLSAAANLLLMTIEHFGDGAAGPAMSVLIQKLRAGIPSNCSVWSPDQAALRFFTAMLIHQDVIASTCLQERPMLSAHYHEFLVESVHRDASSDLLFLEDFTGCPYWVMRVIAQTSILAKWKIDAKNAGSFDVFALVGRGSITKQALRDGQAVLDMDENDAYEYISPSTEMSPYQPLESILARSGIVRSPNSSQSASHSKIRRIWACAAEVYLITVMSGWQPGNDLLRCSVAQALDILVTIDNPSWLRTLSWPFCIIGCLATPEQEEAFRDVANSSGGLAMFGTLRDALAIMEEVWSRRHGYDTETWDIAYCLGILGHSVLLV